MEGIDRILKDVQKYAGGEEKAYLSGFSMGGTLAWQMALLRSSHWHAVFPSCAVYDRAGLEMVPEGHVTTDPDMPIYAFQGAKDDERARFDTDWDFVSQLSRRTGFRNVERTVTWRNHSWHHEEILMFCQGHFLGRQSGAPKTTGL
jgi:dienelactone hydrolase